MTLNLQFRTYNMKSKDQIDCIEDIVVENAIKDILKCEKYDAKFYHALIMLVRDNLMVYDIRTNESKLQVPEHFSGSLEEKRKYDYFMKVHGGMKLCDYCGNHIETLFIDKMREINQKEGSEYIRHIEENNKLIMERYGISPDDYKWNIISKLHEYEDRLKKEHLELENQDKEKTKKKLKPEDKHVETKSVRNVPKKKAVQSK